MIDLVHYGGGNLGSVGRCLDRLGLAYRLVDRGRDLQGDCPILFPGVGSFGAVMIALKQRRFTAPLRELVAGGTPYLGLCVGMQVLFDGSEESPGVPGLGLVTGQVRRFRTGKIPQIGWNRITPCAPSDSDRPSGYVYFVNSFYAEPADDEAVSYESDYHGTFCAAVSTRNITAFQFHPEKSGEFGMQLMRNWCDAL